mmetsp:Transcript_5908/g.26146  ORF Transcript_5908/g.26146 Transcript_5908/m.26146 type:complete len:489 (-) Transcript_5908:562-2028(-)
MVRELDVRVESPPRLQSGQRESLRLLRRGGPRADESPPVPNPALRLLLRLDVLEHGSTKRSHLPHELVPHGERDRHPSHRVSARSSLALGEGDANLAAPLHPSPQNLDVAMAHRRLPLIPRADDVARVGRPDDHRPDAPPPRVHALRPDVERFPAFALRRRRADELEHRRSRLKPEPRPGGLRQRPRVEPRRRRGDVPPRVVHPRALPPRHDVESIRRDVPRIRRVSPKRSHRPPQSDASDKREHGVHRGAVLGERRGERLFPRREPPGDVCDVGVRSHGVEKRPVTFPRVDEGAKSGGRSLVSPLHARQSDELVRGGDVRGAAAPLGEGRLDDPRHPRRRPGLRLFFGGNRGVREASPVAERAAQRLASPPRIRKLEPLPLASRVGGETTPLLQHRPGAHAEPSIRRLLPFRSLLRRIRSPRRKRREQTPSAILLQRKRHALAHALTARHPVAPPGQEPALGPPTVSRRVTLDDDPVPAVRRRPSRP